MNYNYHTHTARCGHAIGTDEEYVLRAIEGGMEFMGFADHVPLMFTDGTQTGHRVPVEKAEEYCRSIAHLREKYKDRIDIKTGFEIEYYEEYFDDVVRNAIAYGAEYLIVGQHYISPENNGGKHAIKGTDKNEDLDAYVKCLEAAMKSGYITYIAHPDMFNFSGDADYYRQRVRDICTMSKSCNVPLEINFLGIRDNRIYPNGEFWRIAGEVGCPAVFGLDAHTPQDACDPASLEKAKRIVDKYGVNYIGKPTVKDIRRK